MPSAIQINEQWMTMALELALQGGKAVRPNPFVGAVIVRDNVVVGKGFHTRFGSAHAEREAIADAGDRARGATLFVTLEPCNHHGKTPPCTDAILKAGIAEVVVGMPDPNPDVAGMGMKHLQDAGIPVTMGILEQQCKIQNEVFLVNVLEKRPFIQLKIAQTLDGFIAPEDGHSKWITGEEARTQAHRLRALADTIMVGSGTLRQDNPALTVRHVSGSQPRRVLLTDSLELPLDATLFTDEYRHDTLVLATEPAVSNSATLQVLTEQGIRVIPIQADSYCRADMSHLMKFLWEQNMYLVLIEGGAGLYSSFLQADMVDRIDVFIAPTIFGSGINVFQYIQARSVSNGIRMNLSEVSQIGNDMYAIMRRI